VNGGNGISDPAAAGLRGKAVSERSRGDASDIDGQTERSNGAFGKSDIEGKTARVAASEWGKERVSSEREHMSQSQAATEFQNRNLSVEGQSPRGMSRGITYPIQP
jgi:hypothetical protein